MCTHVQFKASVCSMMDSRRSDDLAVLGLIFAILPRIKKRKHKQWCKQWLQKRNLSSHINLLRELGEEPLDFLNYLRMIETVYQKLLLLVSPLIVKKDTVMRTAISPHERLAATLRFLATGRSYECLKFSTRICKCCPQMLQIFSKPQIFFFFAVSRSQAVYFWQHRFLGRTRFHFFQLFRQSAVCRIFFGAIVIISRCHLP